MVKLMYIYFFLTKDSMTYLQNFFSLGFSRSNGVNFMAKG